jgi:hypothetical protein
MTSMYLSLRVLHALSYDGGDAAGILNEALNPSPSVGATVASPGNAPFVSILSSLARARMVTLDLEGTGDLLSEQEAEDLVGVVKRHWGAHGFCLTRCPDIGRWARAANRQSQPLLLWHQFSPWAGWHLLGHQLHARELDIFRSLCRRRDASGNDLAHDVTIAPQHPRPDASTVSYLARTGHLPPAGPSAFDRGDVERLLVSMAQRRFVLHLGQGRYCVVHPTAPMPGAG